MNSQTGALERQPYVDRLSPDAGSVRTMTSTFNKPVPIVWGQARVTGNLIWLLRYTNTGSLGTFMDLGAHVGFCEGPVVAFRYVWSGKQFFRLLAPGVGLPGSMNQLFGTYSQTPPPAPVFYLGAVPGLSYRGLAYLAFAIQQLNSSLGPPQVPNLSLEIASTFQVGAISANAKTFTASPPSTLNATAHGFTENQNVRLSTTGVLPTGLAAGVDYACANVTANTFQLKLRPWDPAPIVFTGAGTGVHTATPWFLDANPKDVVVDFLTATHYGAGFSSAQIADLTAFETYCKASGSFVGPVLEAQEPAHAFLERLAAVGYSGPFFSEGKLKIIPYCDTAITGNGATFTPNTTAIYALTDDDFLATPGEDPVIVERGAVSDAFNAVKIEFENRFNQYATEVAEIRDEAAIGLFGYRPKDMISLKEIKDPAVAKWVAALTLFREQNVRSTYRFKLPSKYLLLEPMDILTLTESTGTPLVDVPVRITEISEEDDGALSIIAEDFPLGTAVGVAYPNQIVNAYSDNFNVAPGSANAPVYFIGPYLLSIVQLQLWIGVSGSIEYGGCEIWGSYDDVNGPYRFLGRINGRTTTGILTSTLPVVADPDNTTVLGVDLSESEGVLASVTAQQAANGDFSLCYAGGELFSFTNVAQTGPNQFNLTNLRRGLYGTPVSSVASGSRFMFVNDPFFRFAVPQEFTIGRTLYLKFLAFNGFGAGIQALADVSAYAVALSALTMPTPPNVSGFAATVNQTGVDLTWNDVIGHDRGGYEIREGPSWAAGVVRTTGFKGTKFSVGPLTSIAHRYMIKALDTSGNYSATEAVQSVTVNNPGTPVVSSLFAYTDVVLSWTTPSSDHLIDHFDIRFGASFVAGTPLALPKSNSLKTPVVWTGARTFWVAAVDLAGNVGTAGSVAATVVAPSAPVVSASISGPNYIVGWTIPSSTLPIEQYEVRYGASFGAGVSLGKLKGTVILTGLINWSGERQFWVAAIDTAGTVGAAATASLVITSPSQPSIGAQVIDNNVMLTWTDSTQTLAVDHYQVLKGATYAGATVIGNINGRFATIFESASGTYTYWLVAYDTAGNASAAASISATVSQPPDYVLNSNIISQLDSTSLSNVVRLRGANYALSLDGSTQYGQVASVPILDSSVTGLTFEAWVMPNSINQQGGLVSKTVADAFNTSAQLYFEQTNFLIMRVRIGGVFKDVKASTSGFSVKQPLHVIGRWDSTNGVQIAVNGANIATTAAVGTLDQGAGKLFMGALNATTYKCSGLFGPVKIYSRRITDAEVAEHYRGIFKSEASLVAAWDFDEGAGSVGNDDSDNAYDLALIGTPSFALTTLDGRWVNDGAPPCILTPVNHTETFAEHFTVPGWAGPQNQINAGYPLFIEPAPATGYYEEVFDYGTVLAGTQIVATLTSAAVAGTVTVTPKISFKLNAGDAWTDVAGVWSTYATNFRYVKVRLDFAAASGANVLKATVLSNVLNVKLINEAGTVACVSTDSGGTQVNFVRAFVSVIAIELTPKDTTGTKIASYDFTAVPNPTGFKAFMWDRATGARASGTASYGVKGN